ncbi:hypothetical protein C8R43DRAFT_1120797 [Mycena crocata]|nr:hypothetical protein C8R43DRAFT_1120797 [Mycena crocata]
MSGIPRIARADQPRASLPNIAVPLGMASEFEWKSFIRSISEIGNPRTHVLPNASIPHACLTIIILGRTSAAVVSEILQAGIETKQPRTDALGTFILLFYVIAALVVVVWVVSS